MNTALSCDPMNHYLNIPNVVSAMPKKIAFLALLLSLLIGCQNDTAAPEAKKSAPWIKTITLQAGGEATLTLSGILRARYEIPLAFQVAGRILARHVDTGQHVAAGQRLFSLDPRDLDAAVRAAEAQLAAAEAALATARSELERQRKLIAKKFASRQTLDQFELKQRDAASQVKAARAKLDQTRNARGYAELSAEHAGVLIDVIGEPGQVVGIGQTVAVLAREGEREVEVYLADGLHPPRTGSVRLADGRRMPIQLREVAGAADPQSRTWRARYRLQGAVTSLPLGAVVQVQLQKPRGGQAWRVPLGALDERAGGPRVWQVIDGHAQPVPVEVTSLDAETALIRVDLPPSAHVIALGTHLLTPGMAVRERQ